MKILITSILTIFISINLVSLNEDIKEIDLPELGDRVSGAVSSDEEKALIDDKVKKALEKAMNSIEKHLENNEKHGNVWDEKH